MRSGSDMVNPGGIHVNHQPEYAELESAVLLGGGKLWKYQANMVLLVTALVADCLRMRSGSDMVNP